MADKKQPRSLESPAGMLVSHLKKVGLVEMEDNIVEVIHGIFGEIQPTGCIKSSLAKNSSGYATKRLRINGQWKTLTAHRLVLEHSLGQQLRYEDFTGDSCNVRNCINSNHLWESYRLEKYQYRFKKGRIKNVGITAAPTPQKKLRDQEIIPGIQTQIQPNGSRICTLAKRSDGYTIKRTKINGKTKSFYAHQ